MFEVCVSHQCSTPTKKKHSTLCRLLPLCSFFFFSSYHSFVFIIFKMQFANADISNWCFSLFFIFFIFYFILFFTHDFYPHPHPRPTTSIHDPRPTTVSHNPVAAKRAQKRMYFSILRASLLRSRAFKSPTVSILFVISTNSGQNRTSVDRLAGNKPSGIQSSVN